MPSETASAWRRLERGFERVVGAEVRPGEWRIVLPFFANLFLLLAAYYILKVVREPLILLGGSAVKRSYARGLQAGLLVVLVPAYSALANRVAPARLVKWIMGVFVGSLFFFFLAGRLHAAIGFTFFVWLGIFSTLSIAQFWSLANEFMTEAEGKRLFPLIAVGGTLGGIAGAQFAARFIERFTPLQMMLVAATVLAVCMWLTHVGHGAAQELRRGVPAGPQRTRDPRGGFTLVLRDRYLLLIGASVVLVNLITATGDFILAQIISVKAHGLPAAARAHFIGEFYGDLQTWVTVLTALFQILFVARAFKAVGIAGALLLMPIVEFAGYSLFAFVPALATMAVVKVTEGTTDYSLENTIQQALFLPTSIDAKYKAKSAIDTLSKRLGDLGSTTIIAVGNAVGLQVLGFSVVNAAIALLWIGVSLRLRRRQLACAQPVPAEQLISSPTSATSAA